MIGKMLGNRYEILEKLGGGGMAIVYKSRDTFLNRFVTIKVLRPEFTSDEDFIRRFRREAQAVASLSHPNIVNIHDVGQEDGIHYLVMEYIQGDNLKAIIRKNGQLRPEHAVRIAIQVCEALEHAHENHIVHRDVKPHNILITDDGRAKLTDFGIAMEATSATITRTDTIMGSVHYLSPEQARGETATTKSDIYAVGILLYEMLTGKQPYSGDSPIAVAIKHIQETPQPVDEVNPGVPAELAEVVMRAMEKQPEDRYKSAAELARYLELALEDTGQATVVIPADELVAKAAYGAAKNKTTPGKTTRKAGGLTTRVWILATVAVLMAGIVAGGIYYFYNIMNVTPIKVPSVIGMTKEQAYEELTALGLTVSFNEVYDDEEKGKVIAQSIGPEDAAVKPPREVVLTISKGPEMCEVPDLFNVTDYEAEYRLNEAGLKLARPYDEIFHDQVAKGNVVVQSPAAGELVPKGSEVKITISKGPEPKKQQVPDLTRHTLDEARAILAEINLVLNEDDIQQEFKAGFYPGQIIRQNPAPGTEVEEGTLVSVVLHNGPGPVERTARVKISDEIPGDDQEHLVEIVVEDARGRQLQYADSHKAGERINEKITYVGSGVVQVYIDKELIWEDELS
ncbi:Stk1 family PASTA domain-containing Ser/Thr kinase [Desulfallas thermosapovorans]|uniref:non-specific serine/threonine protein kinase n=1 Tax=Desulfallas thermosapovorans DSM 6562 TaxID=1121431 RepID=A0A5S4ZZ14_9FIRM|nr:Stk1 family PASTA domain-containing Ser/Thr kinase [Desulfallas thermosapovorans]TYO97381.1 serine/threonine-protein kinase [Desulfallas thermosapovorans DSM 6562]